VCTQLCMCTHCILVHACTHPQLCVLHHDLRSETGSRFTVPMLLILIVYYKNLQKFCKQRGSANKFDLVFNKLVNYYNFFF
jgi:hypothetical protein